MPCSAVGVVSVVIHTVTRGSNTSATPRGPRLPLIKQLLGTINWSSRALLTALHTFGARCFARVPVPARFVLKLSEFDTTQEHCTPSPGQPLCPLTPKGHCCTALAVLTRCNTARLFSLVVQRICIRKSWFCATSSTGQPTLPPRYNYFVRQCDG